MAVLGKWTLGLYVVCALAYGALAWDRPQGAQGAVHYARQAEAWRQGRAYLTPLEAQGLDDVAVHDGRFFVSFPPLPTLIEMPFGGHVHQGVLWALVFALTPALLLVWLTQLGLTVRRALGLALSYAFGTVAFFSAVQGDVWFAAQGLGTALLLGYLLSATDARKPMLAGLCLGLAYLCRPTMLLAGGYFLVEAWRARQVRAWVRFAVPLAACGAASLWFNQLRFGHPLEFGHGLLAVRWQGRMETWGLFNYHFLSRNLAVMTSSLPWLSGEWPHVKVSTHGLALWATSPFLFWVLWPREVTPRMKALMVAVLPVLVVNLLYQNSGWMQFGYRFALDYLALVMGLLALGGRAQGRAFWGAVTVAVMVNLAGAYTFMRRPEYYDPNGDPGGMFQPD